VSNLSSKVTLPTLDISPDEAKLAVARALTRPHSVAVEQTVIGAVSQHARAHPTATAVIQCDSSLTYEQLVRRVEVVRHNLRAAGCQPGALVAVLGPRSIDTIATFLALESLGAVYLPLAEDWPDTRIAWVLSRAAPVLIVLHGEAEQRTFGGTATCPTVRLADREMSTDVAPHRSRCENPEELRYVIYTSGTTGTPKGAAVEHRGMLNHLWAKVSDLELRAEDIVAFTAPVVFDISVWQMAAPLLCGGAVAIVGDDQLHYPRRLLRTLRGLGVTVAEFVPTVVGWLADAARVSGPPPSLRWLISTGEQLQPTLARRVLASMPGIPLLNAYGPTECSDDVTHHKVELDDTAQLHLPVGRPIINASLYVLIQDGDSWRSAAPGEPGELFIGGVAVGPGYLGEPELTACSFYQDSFDPGSPTGRLYRTGDGAVVENSMVYCLGRFDRQVKITGVRMELSEIEATLSQHQAIRQCAVVVDTTGPDPKLVAHYIPDGSPTPSDELTKWLGERLPRAMVPQIFLSTAELPLTTNGKVDLSALARTHD
jgi:amino acid adenylation domain-containing protein